MLSSSSTLDLVEMDWTVPPETWASAISTFTVGQVSTVFKSPGIIQMEQKSLTLTGFFVKGKPPVGFHSFRLVIVVVSASAMLVSMFVEQFWLPMTAK